MRLVRGDLARNGVWAEVIVGELTSLEAATPRVLARFFTQAYGSTEGKDSTRLVLDNWNPLNWSDDSKRVLQVWEDGHGVKQVVSIDIESGKVTYLTESTRDVVEYALTPDGAAVLYAAKATLPARDSSPMNDGFVVTSRDALALLAGDPDQGDSIAKWWSTERFVRRTAPGSEAVRIERAEGNSVDSWIPLFATRISPDGRLAIVDGTAGEIPESWERYRGNSMASFLKVMAVRARENGTNNFASRQARQWYVVDLDRATSRRLWTAPATGFSVAVWSPDSRSVLFAPTFLPPESSDELGLQGKAVVELEIASGRVKRVPVPDGAWRDGTVTGARWVGTRAIEVEIAGKTLAFARHGKTWKAGRSSNERIAGQRVRIELRQDLNTPPVLFAIDVRTGNEKAILDLNPRLNPEIPLGKAELVSWRSSDGVDWSGLLYYPLRFDDSRRYPLVIQTHGHASQSLFSLYGNDLGLGLGPGTSVYAGRLLAAHDIAVLTLQDHHDLDNRDVAGEAARYMRAYESAIRHLSNRGLITESRVGLSAFSRTGWHVEYALVHSDFPFAAAITSDNVDANYLQETFLPGVFGSATTPPFGESLRYWLEESTAFNVQRIRTPLRLMRESAGLAEAVVGKWEMFSRLRELNRPVEFYVIPQIDRGSHGVQNPRQVFATQQGTVDWFNFWLNDCERAEPVAHAPESASTLKAQYARWRALRKKRDAVAAEPRPPRLQWVPQPRTEGRTD